MSEPVEVEYVGPFETTDIVIDGRRVPHLEAQLRPGGIVSVIADGRFALDLSVEEAERVVPFLANTIAIAMGYTCHPRADEEPSRMTPFPLVSELPAVEFEQPA